MAARNRLARDELLLGGSRGQRQARCRRRGSGRALRHQGQRALSVACRAVSICRGNAWGQENPGLSGLNLESPDRENAGPCFAKKFEAAKTHRMSCRARTAETVEPVYSSASNAYPATRPAPCATHPRSEEHTSELQSRLHLVCRLLLENKNSAASRDPADAPANCARHYAAREYGVRLDRQHHHLLSVASPVYTLPLVRITRASPTATRY